MDSDWIDCTYRCYKGLVPDRLGLARRGLALVHPCEAEGWVAAPPLTFDIAMAWSGICDGFASALSRVRRRTLVDDALKGGSPT